MQDLVGFLSELHALKIDLFLRQQGLDTTTPAGKALFQMMGVFAEFERAMIAERVRAGLARARGEGKRRLPPHSKNESARLWRLVGGPVCASLPNGLELTPAQCSESAALSSTAGSASFSEAGPLRRGSRSSSSESLARRQPQNASRVNPDSLPFASLNYWPAPPSSTCSPASANPSPCGTARQATGRAASLASIAGPTASRASLLC